MPVLRWIESCAGLFRHSAETSLPRHASPGHSLSLPRLLRGKYLRRTVWPSFRRPAPPAHSDPSVRSPECRYLAGHSCRFPFGEDVCSNVPSYVLGSAAPPPAPIPNQLKPDVEVPACIECSRASSSPAYLDGPARCCCQSSIHGGVSLEGRPPTESCSTRCANF